MTAFANPGIYSLILSVRNKNEKILNTNQSTQINVIVKVINLLQFSF